MQELVGSNVRADLTGSRRRGEKGLKSGPQPAVKMRRQGLERGITRMQGAGEAALGCEEGREALHPLCQRVERFILFC